MMLHRKFHGVSVNILPGVHFHVKFIIGSDSPAKTSLRKLPPVTVSHENASHVQKSCGA